MTNNFRVEHIKDECIGCAACASVCPEYWKMTEDGKSSIIGGKKESFGESLGPQTEGFDCNKEAAESCPVNCIHIYEIKDDGSENKLI